MTMKRFTILYGIDENPFEWDIMDNEKDALICQFNGKPICDLLNELHEENQDLKSFNEDLAEDLSVCANARISKDDLIEKLTRENEQLREENNKLHTKIFEMRTNIALERTEISNQTYTWKNAKEFLNELEKW